MSRTFQVLAAIAMVAMLAISPAGAQQQTERVVGQIEGIDGPTLVIKTPKGEAKVNITANAAVFGVQKATVADIKPGNYIGVGATPQADGSQKAIRVMIFAESQRGTGEGSRPWNRPNTTMTNATVDSTVASVDGQVLVIKYKDGEKKIIIGPDARIMAYLIGDKSELKAGQRIFVANATKLADGTLEVASISYGKDIAPPM